MLKRFCDKLSTKIFNSKITEDKYVVDEIYHFSTSFINNNNNKELPKKKRKKKKEKRKKDVVKMRRSMSPAWFIIYRP